SAPSGHAHDDPREGRRVDRRWSASGADLPRQLDHVVADGVPVALGLEVALLAGAVLMRTDDEAGRQAALLRRREVAVVGGAQHHLVRLEIHAVDHAEIGFGVGLVVLEGLAREAVVPRDAAVLCHVDQQRDVAVGQRGDNELLLHHADALDRIGPRTELVPEVGEFPRPRLAGMLQAALLQQHLEGLLVEVVDARPRQLALANAAYLRLVEAAPVVGEARPVGLHPVFLADFGQVLDQAAAPVHHRAEHVEDADLEVAEILGHYFPLMVWKHNTVAGTDGKARCGWASADPLYQQYHDREWGRPLKDDQALFELLSLEGFQAGLSWITVLRKREHYRKVYDGFDPRKVARYTPAKVEKLLADPGIIRHRGKIEASIGNAKAYLALIEREGSFARFLWSFVGGKPRKNSPKNLKDVPARTAESDAMSKALQKAGFKFVGSTICYAFMQASGMVDD